MAVAFSDFWSLCILYLEKCKGKHSWDFLSIKSFGTLDFYHAWSVVTRMYTPKLDSVGRLLAVSSTLVCLWLVPAWFVYSQLLFLSKGVLLHGLQKWVHSPISLHASLRSAIKCFFFSPMIHLTLSILEIKCCETLPFKNCANKLWRKLQ